MRIQSHQKQFAYVLVKPSVRSIRVFKVICTYYFLCMCVACLCVCVCVFVCVFMCVCCMCVFVCECVCVVCVCLCVSVHACLYVFIRNDHFLLFLSLQLLSKMKQFLSRRGMDCSNLLHHKRLVQLLILHHIILLAGLTKIK